VKKFDGASADPGPPAGPADPTGPRPPQYPIESVDNALRILLLFGERSEVRLTDISEYLGVASSTAHRLLAMLLFRGFVRQDPRTKLYRPGNALTGVAYSILQRFDFRAALRPFLEHLNTELRETVHLGMLDGATVRFIDAIESPQAVRVASRLGMAFPATSTSTGKALLAQLTVVEVHALYPADELEGLTEKSLRSRDELDRQLAQIRRRGYALSSEESERGVSSVAVAFAQHLAPAPLAFNVSVPSSRMSRAEQQRIGSALLVAVEQASAVLHS
jgi:DNA-binding IclR family transcriptional regulator